MLFRKNPKNSSEILQSVAKLAGFFYFLSNFQGIIKWEMFHVKRHIEIKSFSNAKWLKKRAAGNCGRAGSARRRRVIPHSVGKCPEGTKGQGIF